MDHGEGNQAQGAGNLPARRIGAHRVKAGNAGRKDCVLLRLACFRLAVTSQLPRATRFESPQPDRFGPETSQGGEATVRRKLEESPGCTQSTVPAPTPRRHLPALSASPQPARRLISSVAGKSLTRRQRRADSDLLHAPGSFTPYPVTELCRVLRAACPAGDGSAAMCGCPKLPPWGTATNLLNSAQLILFPCLLSTATAVSPVEFELVGTPSRLLCSLAFVFAIILTSAAIVGLRASADAGLALIEMPVLHARMPIKFCQGLVPSAF